MPDRILVITNPVSGRGNTRRVLAELLQRASAAGIAAEMRCTTAGGDAARFAAPCTRASHRAIVVVGGDGTVNDTIGGVGPDSPPILVVPGGTENILAKSFGLRLDAALLMSALTGGRTARLDLAAMNGRRFLMVSGCGFDAECVRRVTIARRGRITYAHYFWPIWRAFWKYRHPHLCVEADGKAIFDGRGLAIIGNVRRYAWGLQPTPRAKPDDGLLDVCVYVCDSHMRLLRHVGATILSRHVAGPDVIYAQARQIRVTSPESVAETRGLQGSSADRGVQSSALRPGVQSSSLHECVGVEIDGDWGGQLPAEYEILNRQAEFLVPANWSPPT